MKPLADLPSGGARLPRHVGIIMDGNGRWAKARGLDRSAGHAAGAQTVREIVTAAREIGIRALTLYAFSSENWARPSAEVDRLMSLLAEYLEGERATILENGIRLQAIGDTTRLPASVRSRLERLSADSAHHGDMVLSLALSYGSREELVHACRALAERVQDGALTPAAISEADVEAALWTRGLPPLDLVIRTSGERRLSNFLLWQAAYAELYFSDLPWPSFDRAAFEAALSDYGRRERRFGALAPPSAGGRGVVEAGA